MIIIEFDHLVL